MQQCGEFYGVEKKVMLTSLLDKARARHMEPTQDSFDDDELRKRARAQYHTLADEVVGALPYFELSFEHARQFYRGLPWESSKLHESLYRSCLSHAGRL